MRSVLEVASVAKARGIILGKTEQGSVICLPEDTRLNKHIAVFGASGTKKSRGVIRPAIFQSIRRGESVIVSDPKSEMYADTAELFRKRGYTVRVYNLLQPEFSDLELYVRLRWRHPDGTGAHRCDHLQHQGRRKG